MKPILITHPDCLQHQMPRHPERPERLTAVLDGLSRAGIIADMAQSEASEIPTVLLKQIHPEAYIQRIASAEKLDRIIKVDPDTYMSPGSNRAAKLAAGAAIEATRRVLDGETKRAFCAVRPPGHHAEIAEAFGFCLFNNIALGAQVALDRPDIHRVAILDFDVHHCNGTVDIFKDVPEVLVCSSFQNHFYPHRFLDFNNSHIVTTPLDAGTGSLIFRKAIETSWLPAIQTHKPDIIFISAGFDAHAEDPLAELNLDEDDFRWITRFIVDLANSYSQGRIVSTLEGGYDLSALARSASAHVEELISDS